MNVLPYYIYLDSKIVGTAKQIATFFVDQIFSSTNTTVLIKKYKHKSAKQIANIFRQQNITYQFVLAEDLDKLENGIIFYPFNAQSNCRAVANRKLMHIFITHGESNKAASVKPIIRIYDYVFTSGQVGINRFLAYGIFSEYDVDVGRIIMVGDTFVGKTGLSSKGEKCIFYAPTWEGGIEQENYSSLAFWENLAERILFKQVKYQVNSVLIRLHPNTGYRLSIYQKHILSLVRILLKKENNNIILYEPNLSLSFWKKLELRKIGVRFVNELSQFQAVFAFCDISAMETQLVNENISYELFYPRYQSTTIAIPDLNIYCEVAKIGIQAVWLSLNNALNYRKHLINVQFEQIKLSNRITFLMNDILQFKKE